MSTPPRLGGNLIVRKGEAAPAVAAENVPPAPARTVERPAASKPVRASVPHGLGGTIAVTVRRRRACCGPAESAFASLVGL